MKTPTKFVKPLMDEQREQLKEIMKSQGPQRKRMRAHAVLLSERRYSIDPIADIYQVDRDRVSKGLEWWEEYQFEGLDDDPRSGRPPKLTEKEQKKAVEITLEEPGSLQQGLSKMAEQIGKTISRDTLKQMLALNEYVWKRMRRSLKSLRNEEEFRAAQAELATLRTEALDPAREFDRFYFDEAGFTLTPCIPYAWQKVGQTFERACAHGPRQNVLGFLNLHHEFHAFAFEGSINTSIVTHCFDLFSQPLVRPALVVIDNAPIHTSGEFEEPIELWQERGLNVKFIPPYCPELNLIEILWRKIKYEWLPLDAYQSFKAMTQVLFEILSGIGSKYLITFA
jgi:transposase